MAFNLAALLQLLSDLLPVAGSVANAVREVHSTDDDGTKIANIAANAQRVVDAVRNVSGVTPNPDLTRKP